jgi:AcrR family transcriptional regulator
MSVIELNLGDDHRSRLLQGLAISIREKGLAGTQITDIVGHAKTSRRTFYECFPDKEACFLEFAERLGSASVEIVAGAVDPVAPWERQVEQAVDAYLGLLAADPKMAIAFSSELPTLGGRWMETRTQGVERFAELVVRLTRSPGMREGGIEPLSIEKAVMIVAGIDGMVIRAVHNDESIIALAAPAKEIVRGALR